MMNGDDHFDPTIIIRAADDKRKNNDLNGAQMIFMSALLDWVDSAREGQVSNPDQVREAIATLWIAYAHFNQSTNLFKTATEVYEQAVSCPIAGSVGRVWLDYARFAQERDKLRTAQKIYLRSLQAVTDEQDRNVLWSEFLEMMRQTKPELTMAALKKAVEEEALVDATPDAVTSAASADEDDLERPGKRPRLNDNEEPSEMEESKSHVVTAEAVAAEANDLWTSTQSGLPPELSAAWFVRDGDSPPTPPRSLFSASPPKLADPTGKDILGKKLALAVITRLLKGEEGTILLEVCRGLWMLTAVQEREATKIIERLDQSISAEMEELDASLETRLSVAGAASSAVQQMNDNERSAFHQSCYQRRQEALSSIAWDFRTLLCTQQQVLMKLQVPGFDEPTVDSTALELQSRLCSYLHSAFYLRARIGEGPHEAMLKSQAERLKKDLESTPAQPRNTNLPPPPSFPPQPPPMYNPAFPPQQQYTPGIYMQQQYPGQPMQMMPQRAPPYGQQQPPPFYQL